MANISWTSLKEVGKDGTATLSEMRGSSVYADFVITLKKSSQRTWPTSIKATVKKGKAKGAPTRASSPGDAKQDCQRFVDALEEYVIMQSKPVKASHTPTEEGFTYTMTKDLMGKSGLTPG